ncbi:MAG TPA: DUF2199 domain-containing protein [Lysobacter sp.]
MFQNPNVCACCGKPHDPLGLVVPIKLPDEIKAMGWVARKRRTWFNGDDMFVIDRERFFVYGSLKLPVREHDARLTWGVWVEVTHEAFMEIQDQMAEPGCDALPPFEGTLANQLRFYGTPTFGMAMTIHLRPGQRPLMKPVRVDHALSQDHHDGIDAGKVFAIRAWAEATRDF